MDAYLVPFVLMKEADVMLDLALNLV